MEEKIKELENKIQELEKRLEEIEKYNLEWLYEIVNKLVEDNRKIF